jgi:hypothetical protein
MSAEAALLDFHILSHFFCCWWCCGYCSCLVVKEEDLIRRPKIDPLFLVGNLQCVEVVALGAL